MTDRKKPLTITIGELTKRINPALADLSIFSRRLTSQFEILSIDDDGAGGYDRGRVGDHLMRFDRSGTQPTPKDGYRVRMTVLKDVEDVIGTLVASGESWSGHQIPARAFQIAGVAIPSASVGLV